MKGCSELTPIVLMISGVAGIVVLGTWLLALKRIRLMPEDEWADRLSRACARASWAMIAALAVELIGGFWSGNVGRPVMSDRELAVGLTVFGLAFLLSALSIRGAFMWSAQRLQARWHEGHRW